jgi:hypothetical protein
LTSRFGIAIEKKLKKKCVADPQEQFLFTIMHKAPLRLSLKIIENTRKIKSANQNEKIPEKLCLAGTDWYQKAPATFHTKKNP